MLAKLADELKSAYADFKFIVKTEVLQGDPSEKIIEFSKNQKADLIVIGNIGPKWFFKTNGTW